MTWLASSTGIKRPAFTKRPWIAAVCSQAAFDGGPDDPRTLVYEYQQELRAELLDELLYEIEEADHPSHWLATVSACQDALLTCEAGLRWLWLAEPRRNAAPVRSTATSAPIVTTGATEMRPPVATAGPAAVPEPAPESAPVADAPSCSLPLAA